MGRRRRQAAQHCVMPRLVCLQARLKFEFGFLQPLFRRATIPSEGRFPFTNIFERLNQHLVCPPSVVGFLATVRQLLEGRVFDCKAIRSGKGMFTPF
jgi:hypothetical protein